MKKILFDFSSIMPAPNGVVNHGGAEYSKVIFDYCVKKAKLESEFEIYIYAPYESDYVNNFLSEYKKICNFVLFIPSEKENLEDFVNKQKFDSIFSGLVVGDFLKIKLPKETKYILTEHGLRGIEIKFDKFFLKTEKKKLKNFVKMVYSKISYESYLHRKRKMYEKQFVFHSNVSVFTVSNHSKYSIQYNYPFLKNKVNVCYSPMKISKKNVDDSLLKKFNVNSKKYILLINANRGEKNCLRGIMALKKLYNLGLLSEEYKVIILGCTYNKPFRKILKKDEKFLLYGYVSTEELECLYKNAHLFLYPTINEGFGYPPLEAMKYGTIVACSAVCSITEVCGDSVLYFNPYDIMEICNRVLQSFDSNIVSHLKMKQIDRLRYIEHKQKEGLEFLYDEIFIK